MPDSPKKSGPGRPKKESSEAYTERFQTRLTPAQATRFRVLADRRETSPSRLMRSLMTGKIKDVEELVISPTSIAHLRRSCGRLDVIRDRLERLDDDRTADVVAELEREIEALRQEVRVLGGQQERTP